MRVLIYCMVLLQLLGCSDTRSDIKDAPEKISYAVSNQTYHEALQRAKDENKSIFILMETEQCRWCKRLKATTLQDQNLLKRLENEFVFLTLNRDHSDYPGKFATTGVPTVYMIDSNEEIYAKVVGYREDPKEYLKWFDYIAIERGIEQ